MKFCIIGTGGVGGYFGAKIARSGTEEVWFIARGAHLEAMRTSGLRITATDEQFVIPPGRMSDRFADVGPCDVVLVCVKAYDTESVARRLGPLLARHTIVISLQNGVDNEETIARLIPAGRVFGGIAYIYSTITAPGQISETGGPRMIVFGPLEKGAAAQDQDAIRILSCMRKAGIQAAVSADIRSELWKKFVFISAVGGLTALSRLTLGEILAVGPTCRLLQDAMREGVEVARAAGAVIEPDFVETTFRKLERYDNATRSSMYYDLSHGKPLEVEALSGAVVRYGRESGIHTPIHATLYAALLPYHLAGDRRRSSTNNKE